jgi:hypothetical protein
MHKVTLTIRKGQTVVSCQCRPARGHSPVGQTMDPIGTSKNFDETKELYNDPANHFQQFTEADKIGQ